MKLNKNLIQLILAVLGVVFSMGWFALLMFKDYPPENRDMINTITGALITVCLGQIFNFYFGSSKSSSDKTDLLNNTNT